MAVARSLARRVFGSMLNGQSFVQREMPACLQRLKHTASLQKGQDSESLPQWQLCAAVCMTRLPLVSPNLTEIEEKYFEMLREQELERSVLSDWEMEKMRQTEIIKAVEMGEKDTMDLDFSVTHEDIEDEHEAKLKEFLDTERNSEDDMDLKNVNRKMRDSLAYVVQKKLGNDEVWVLPSVPIEDGETMKECAERALSLHSTRIIQSKILSNAPCAFYKYKYPKKGVRLKSRDNYVGAKIFIYSALVQAVNNSTSGQKNAETTDILDSVWVTKDELSKYLKPKYCQTVRRILH